MNLDDIISPEVLDEFSRTPEAWAEAFNEAADDHKNLSDLVEDMYLDPLLKAVPKRDLVKLGAKLLGTTARALTADLKLGAVENEPRRDHLSLAREAVESFGEGPNLNSGLMMFLSVCFQTHHPLRTNYSIMQRVGGQVEAVASFECDLLTEFR